MAEIKAVAFDLDHTLYDRNATWDALTAPFRNCFADCLRPGLTASELTAVLKSADYRGTYEETSWRGMYQDLLEQGIFLSPPGLPRFRGFIDARFPGAIVPYPDTYTVLAWCRSHNLHPSVITNGHRGLQDDKLRCMGLSPYLEECIICDLDSGVGCKPEPDGFLELARRLNIPPENILYVGDNPRNDILGARGAGMQTAWLDVMDNWKDGLPPADYQLSSLSDLKRILGNT